ncbi:flagellar hook-associated protein FlgK [Zymobacter sp. IVIA_5232.4 C2]|uniref:flagellar hook-associated protein FlgK n=1 Tax=Zymobacter sp. IVIA_5232.4 C2 TaxID=3394855 RepID=UPI0039C48A72
MSNLFSIATSGLRNANAQLATTSNNLDNYTNKNYSRQYVTSTEAPQSGGVIRVGSGVFTSNAERYYDATLNNQRNSSYSSQADYTAQQDGLNKLDKLYTYSSTDSTSLDKRINEFFSATSTLAQDPTSTAARQTVLSNGQSMANLFNSLSSQLQTYESTADATIKTNVEQVNKYGEQISQLNEKISKVRAETNAEPNELLDARDQAVAELSKIVGVDVIAQDGTQLNISLSDGSTLVAGSDYFKLDETRAQTLTGGTLGGTAEFRNGDLANARTNLSNLAQTVVTQVNAIQTQGYDMDGQQGSALFEIEANAPDVAAGIKVALTDPRKLAAASASDSGEKDNRNALLLADLQNQRFQIGNTEMSFSEAYASNVSAVGTAVTDINNRVTAQGKVTAQLEEKQQSLSGVNTDEEFSNLMQFQTYYKANSKILSTAMTLMDTILQLN